MPGLYPGHVNVVDTIAVLLFLVGPVVGFEVARRRGSRKFVVLMGSAVLGGLAAAAISILLAIDVGRWGEVPHPAQDIIPILRTYSLTGLAFGFASVLGRYASRHAALSMILAGITLAAVIELFQVGRAVELHNADEHTNRISGIVYRALPNGGEPGSVPVAVGADAFLYNPVSGGIEHVQTDSSGEFYFEVDDRVHQNGDVVVCVPNGVPIANRASVMGAAPVTYQPGVRAPRLGVESMTRMAHMRGWMLPLPKECVVGAPAEQGDDAQRPALMTMAPVVGGEPAIGAWAFIRKLLSRPDSVEYRPVEGREMFVRLPDETIVQLEPGAVLKVARAMGPRRERGARLAGVARLVAEPTGVPFYLWTPAVKIRMDSMSTVLVVRALPDSTDVIPERGKVLLDLLDPAGDTTNVQPMVELDGVRVRTATEWSRGMARVARADFELRRVRALSTPPQLLPPLPAMYGGSTVAWRDSVVAARSHQTIREFLHYDGDMNTDGALSLGKSPVSHRAAGDTFSVVGLPDQTIVQLAPGAVVTHASDMSSSSNRVVRLEGMARLIVPEATQKLYLWTPEVKVRFDEGLVLAIVRTTPAYTDVFVERGQVFVTVLEADGRDSNVNPFVIPGFGIRVRSEHDLHHNRDPYLDTKIDSARVKMLRGTPRMPGLNFVALP